ncbi:MAG: hypothetical protein K6E18_02155 [Lachnospiraceae bacterium]|nr:hypothetical protein [Lachnospiraceae bacterium]
MSEKFKSLKNSILPLGVLSVTILALVLYTFLYLNHLMHSDMAAEVILSKLLAERGEWISTEWFYSTEIRILYTQLVMTPLFWIFSDFHTVKVLSILIFLLLLLAAGVFMKRTFRLSALSGGIVLMLLFSPWSNEYLDMMFLGNFYTPQTILMFVFLGMSFHVWKKKLTKGIALSFLAILSVLLGLSGLRYPACLFAPLFLALLWDLILEGMQDRADPFFGIGGKLLQTGVLGAFAGTGFLIHKGYLAKHYSFDQTPVTFVPISEVWDRALGSVRQMLEFFGYRDGVSMMSGLGLVNVVKCGFLILFVYMIIRLYQRRKELLDRRERVFLYYFIFLFLINLYMLVFTTVLMQYRYWIPVFIVGIYLVGLYLDRAKPVKALQKQLLVLCLCAAAASSLYGELWQDVKFDDCAKREGYMAFLEKEGYTFGYATFWNGPVTEYLSNGKIHVGNLGPENRPYEWLTPKSYYKKGYHTGKTFLLLARTEEAGMLNGDFTVMEDGRCVYQDEYYAVYEGEGMYVLSK